MGRLQIMFRIPCCMLSIFEMPLREMEGEEDCSNRHVFLKICPSLDALLDQSMEHLILDLRVGSSSTTLDIKIA